MADRRPRDNRRLQGCRPQGCRPQDLVFSFRVSSPSGFSGFLVFLLFITPVAGVCLGMRPRPFLFFLLFLSKGASS
jgi:hypothetical protein